MKLNLSQIQSVAFGAAEVTQEADGFHFYRFNARQRQCYLETNKDFYRKTFATSGVKLQFFTDSKTLKLDVTVSSASSRSYFALDVAVNDRVIGSLDNLTEDMPRDYTGVALPLGDYSKTFALGDGKKKVCLYLPWSVCLVIKALELDDGATIEPAAPKYKLLAFGDSITHGYDAKHPSNKYITRIAQALDAQEYNKAIGGDEFFPPLAEAEDLEDPDYITVAYGTNDWSHCAGREVLEEHCSAFYQTLSAKYPNAKIFALTPIWRLDWELEKPVGPFHDVEAIIRAATADLKNVTVVRGFGLVPENTDLFADIRLHPNDSGFDYYFRNLYQTISQKI